MALAWESSNSIVDESAKTSLLLFEKEPAHGTVQLTLDDKETMTFLLYSKIKVQISLSLDDTVESVDKDEETETPDIGLNFEENEDAAVSKNDISYSPSVEVTEIEDCPSAFVQPKVEPCTEAIASEAGSESIGGEDALLSNREQKKRGRKRGRPRKVPNQEDQAVSGKKRKYTPNVEVKLEVEDDDGFENPVETLDQLNSVPKIVLKPLKMRKGETIIVKGSRRKLKGKNRAGSPPNNSAQKTSLQKTMTVKTKTKETVLEESSGKRKRGPVAKSKRKVNGKVKIKCEYCEKVFLSTVDYYDHKKIPNLPTFFCVLCKKEFQFKAFLEIHEKYECLSSSADGKLDQSPVDPLMCRQCSYKARDMYTLKRHTMYHTGENQYKCCLCDRLFVEGGTLTNHLNSHISGGMVTCKCCDQKFTTRADLCKHQLRTMEIKCHLCGQTFQNRTIRTEHYKTNHKDDILRCSQCDRMFSSQEELDEHVEKHKLYKKKPCPICGKFYSSLERHLRTHGQVPESKMYVCDKCPQKFAHRSSFQRHISIHSTDLHYQCPECPRKFSDCAILRRHLTSHSTVLPYQCDICGKKCKEAGNLRKHMRIHSKTRPFPCPQCPLTFNHKSSLDSHVATQHPQQKDATVLAPGAPPDMESTLKNSAVCHIPANSSSQASTSIPASTDNQPVGASNTDNQTSKKATSSASNSADNSACLVNAKPPYFESSEQSRAMNLSFGYHPSQRNLFYPVPGSQLPPAPSLSSVQYGPSQGEERWMPHIENS